MDNVTDKDLHDWFNHFTNDVRQSDVMAEAKINYIMGFANVLFQYKDNSERMQKMNNVYNKFQKLKQSYGKRKSS